MAESASSIRSLTKNQITVRAIGIRELAPKQAAMLFSPMSVLKRITDSSQTSRQVRKVPISDIDYPVRQRLLEKFQLKLTGEYL